jgi:hypothetical protein
MRKFLVLMMIVLCGLPFGAHAQAQCPQTWRGVTYDWQEACEVIQNIKHVAKTGGEVSDNSPDARRVAVVSVCIEACGRPDFGIEPKDPRKILYRIKGGRVCLAPGEGVRESPNPGAALEVPEDVKKRCSQSVQKRQ